MTIASPEAEVEVAGGTGVADGAAAAGAGLATAREGRDSTSDRTLAAEEPAATAVLTSRRRAACWTVEGAVLPTMLETLPEPRGRVRLEFWLPREAVGVTGATTGLGDEGLDSAGSEEFTMEESLSIVGFGGMVAS